MQCSNCGSQNPQNAQFCGNCGANLQVGGAAGAQQAQQPTQPIPPPQPTQQMPAAAPQQPTEQAPYAASAGYAAQPQPSGRSNAALIVAILALAGVLLVGIAVGAFFIYVVIHNIHRLIWGQPAEGRTREQVEAGPVWPRLAIGFPMGVSAGLLGIGGGSLAVPAQQMGLKVPLRNAIATSSATIASVSWIGAIVKNVQLGDNGSVTRSLLLAACLAPTAMIGSYVGGHLTHRLPVKVVRVAFVLLMLYASAKMFGWV